MYIYTYTYSYIQDDQKSLCTWWLQYRKLQAMFKMSPTSLQTLTRRTVFSKTVFNIARSTLRMYSVMAIFKSSTVEL